MSIVSAAALVSFVDELDNHYQEDDDGNPLPGVRIHPRLVEGAQTTWSLKLLRGCEPRALRFLQHQGDPMNITSKFSVSITDTWAY